MYPFKIPSHPDYRTKALEVKYNLVTQYSFQSYLSPNQVLENLQKPKKTHRSWVPLPAHTTVVN